MMSSSDDSDENSDSEDDSERADAAGLVETATCDGAPVVEVEADAVSTESRHDSDSDDGDDEELRRMEDEEISAPLSGELDNSSRVQPTASAQSVLTFNQEQSETL